MLHVIIDIKDKVISRELARAASSELYQISEKPPVDSIYVAVLIKDSTPKQLPPKIQLDINYYQAFGIYLVDFHSQAEENDHLTEATDDKSEKSFCHQDELFDFVFKKPFKIQDLIATINNCIASCVSNIRVFKKNYLTDYRRKIIYNKTNNKIINLTDKEADLLFYILNHKCYNQAIVVTKEELLKNVWQYSEKINTSTIETHISRLRLKLHRLDLENLEHNNFDITNSKPQLDTKNISWLTWQNDGYIL